MEMVREVYKVELYKLKNKKQNKTNKYTYMAQNRQFQVWIHTHGLSVLNLNMQVFFIPKTH